MSDPLPTAEKDALAEVRVVLDAGFPLPNLAARNLLAERDRMSRILAELGFCPVDGEAMPCFTCGAGL